jgi:hypothetical protein
VGRIQQEVRQRPRWRVATVLERATDEAGAP